MTMTTTEPFLFTMGGPRVHHDAVLIEPADTEGVAAHRALRHAVFVQDQGVFAAHDHDDVDDDPDTVVLVARDAGSGEVLGGVRVHPHHDREHGPVGHLGWWRGSRLVVRPDAGALGRRVGTRLVRAAMALAEDRSVVRFDAAVQLDKVAFFERLGWQRIGDTEVAGVRHALLLAPQPLFERAVRDHKLPLGRLLAGWHPGGAGFVGDDAAPVPGAAIVAACDAVVPAMVERDPEWAGWCSVLVNLNDLAAMGARPVGLLDAVAGRDEAHVARILAGVRAAAEAYGVAVLGGHTQLGGHSSLAVTALGATDDPVPAGGGRPGHELRLVADLGGSWRPGYAGRQWDSTSQRSPAELRHLITTLERHRPAAAKDVSMAGLVGTLAMLAEASAVGAEVDVAAVPVPGPAAMGDWLTCFPGFALLTADPPGMPPPEAAPAVVATIGRLTDGAGVQLRWPDGHTTTAVAGPGTGMGRA
jgi:putative N-acetyltransferase (TIGR04045 family)